jgi:spectinomycin phosphotransferase
MRTRPEIADDSIITRLYDSFRLLVNRVVFLPVGADFNSFAFRATADDGSSLFLKLSRRTFDEVAVTVPAYLHAQGIRRVMAPVPTITHQLWLTKHGLSWVLYPYFDGRNGFEAVLSTAQWIALGETIKAVHTTELPAALRERLPRESYSPRNRSIVAAFDQQVRRNAYADPIAARFAVFWNTGRDEIQHIVERAERLVADLAAYAEQILGLQGSAEDREEGLGQLVGQFLPGRVVEIAHRSYPDTE